MSFQTSLAGLLVFLFLSLVFPLPERGRAPSFVLSSSRCAEKEPHLELARPSAGVPHAARTVFLSVWPAEQGDPPSPVSFVCVSCTRADGFRLWTTLSFSPACPLSVFLFAREGDSSGGSAAEEMAPQTPRRLRRFEGSLRAFVLLPREDLEARRCVALFPPPPSPVCLSPSFLFFSSQPVVPYASLVHSHFTTQRPFAACVLGSDARPTEKGSGRRMDGWMAMLGWRTKIGSLLRFPRGG